MAKTNTEKVSDYVMEISELKLQIRLLNQQIQEVTKQRDRLFEQCLESDRKLREIQDILYSNAL